MIYKPRKDFIRNEAGYKECAKKWVAITANTLLFYIVFRKYCIGLTIQAYSMMPNKRAARILIFHNFPYHHINWQYTKTPKYTLFNFRDFLKIWQLREI